MLFVLVASRVQHKRLRRSFAFFFVLERIFIICSSEFFVFGFLTLPSSSSPDSVSLLLRGLVAASTPDTTFGTSFSAKHLITFLCLDKVLAFPC